MKHPSYLSTADISPDFIHHTPLISDMPPSCSRTLDAITTRIDSDFQDLVNTECN